MKKNRSKVAMFVSLALTVFLAAACGGGEMRGAEGGGGDSGGGSESASFDRPIDLVVPFGPGGGADQLGRLASSSMEEDVGTSFPVVNTPGATGGTGMTSMLTAAPGDSMAVFTQDVLAPVSFGAASFELDELRGVCRLQDMPSALFIQSDGEYENWQELADAARENPGELRVATVGQGSPDDVILAALAEEGIEFRAVPFAEPSERYSALLGGSVDALYEQPGDVRQNLEGGQFEPALVFADEPVEGLPGDPVLGPDAGVDIALNQFRGIAVNSETDDATVNALSDACASLAETDRFTEFQTQSFATEGSYMEAGEFDSYIREADSRLSELAGEYGLN